MSPEEPWEVAAGRLAELAEAEGIRMATAESCTGGLVGKILTDRSGASAYYVGGVVAYADEVKTALLGVSEGVLASEGAVSEAVAQQMAEGICRALNANLGLAVTGVAGPSGGTPEKPVGTVWVAVRLANGTCRTRLLRLRGDRNSVRIQSAWAVLELAAAALDG